jgi:hypothetical protein
MRVEIVKIKVEARCLSCEKCYVDEDDKDCEQLFCSVDGSEVDDEHDCPLWECNFDVFNVCGFEVEGAETPTLSDGETVDHKNVNLAKQMGYIK